jgi:nucleoside-diphosphate-sugar epimerase
VSWIGQAVAAVVQGRPYHVAAGADDGYELTYVKDTADGLVRLLHAGSLAHAVYHVASGGRLIRLAEVAAALAEIEPAADVDFAPGRHSGAARRTPLGIGRLVTETGFAPRWPLPAALADYLAAERTGDYGAEVPLLPEES